MEFITQAEAMRERSRGWRREALRIALVPTMGALHAGHLALIAEARRRAARVALSIYVNPTQFGPTEDFSTYPRAREADLEAAQAAGVDAVFAPSDAEMYPEGYQTYVQVERLSRGLCGAFRQGHFRGVATIVTQLFIIAEPDVAIFGWKDAQQFLLLKRLVRDLHLPVEMIGVETVREADALALSSRNRYLSPEERAVAPALYRALEELSQRAAAGEDRAKVLLDWARGSIEAASPRFAVQYLEMVSLDRMEPLARVQPGNTLVAAAVFLGTTRLIDNVRL